MGNLFRLLLFALAVWVILRFLQKLLNKPADPNRHPDSTDMLPCAHCGVYVPKNEAVWRDGKFYCSRQHLEANGRGN